MFNLKLPKTGQVVRCWLLILQWTKTRLHKAFHWATCILRVELSWLRV